MPIPMTSTTTTVMTSGIMRTWKTTGKGIIEKAEITDDYQKVTTWQHTHCSGRHLCFTALSEERGFHFFASSEMTALKKVYVVITFPCSVMN